MKAPVRLTDNEPLSDLLLRAKAKVAAMTPEERFAMIKAQEESWVRGMTARCEHGEVDYEQCQECRAAKEGK